MPTKTKKPEASEDKTILINFVLDKSGSMSAIREATISAFNEFKNDQAREAGNAYMTLTVFDTETNCVAEAAPLREVPDLTHESYAPNGGTALYDAIGATMRVTDDFNEANHPDQVLFVIMTDGEENASREFRRDTIFQMIEDRQRNAQYEFIYLGANQDSYAVGMHMGIREGRMVDYGHDSIATQSVMSRVGDNVRAYRRYGKKQAPEMFCEDFESMGADDGAALEAKKATYEEGQRRKGRLSDA